MEKIKIGIKQSKKGLISSIIAIVGIVVGLVMYIVTTGNTNGKVSIVLTVIAIIAALLAATSCFLFYADGFFIHNICRVFLVLHVDVRVISGGQHRICGSRDLRYRIWNPEHADRGLYLLFGSGSYGKYCGFFKTIIINSKRRTKR